MSRSAGQYKIPPIGSVINNWKVINIATEKTTHGAYLIPVECQNCGNRENKALYSLKKSKCFTCTVAKRRQVDSGMSVNLFNRIKDGATKRGLEFSITASEIVELFNKQQGKCALSGVEIFFDISSKTHQKRSKNTTASLDRKDSAKGYVMSNLQWIHKKINIMKMDMDESQFIDFCDLISKHKKTEPRIRIIARTQVEGIHRWRKCPLEEVSYLREYHRHIFKIEAIAFVSHGNRDIEFIQLSHQIKNYLTAHYYSDKYKCLFFDDKSCEMIAEELVKEFNLHQCEVNEDGEGGAIVKNI